MKKYTNDYIMGFFCKSNLNCYKLGKILDISTRRVERYLLGDGYAKPEEAMLIDAAISVVENKHLHQPEWHIGEWRKENLNGSNNGSCNKLKAFNEALREMAEEQKQKTEDNAMQIIVWILNDVESDEFHTHEDPLMDCGLEKYGLEEFMHRAERIISKIT